MTKKFAVNIMGYVEDPLGQYTSDQVERMMQTNASMSLSPMKIVAITAKELPDDSISLDAKKAKKRYKFTQ